MSLEAVIWDMDGVIADTAPFHFRSWQQAAQQRGVAFSESDFRQSFGKRNPEIIRGTFGSTLSDSEIARIAAHKEEVFRDLAASKLEAFPGVLGLLRTLRASGFRMAIASSTPLPNIELVLSRLGIADCFDTIVSGEDVSQGKPHPEVFLLAACKLGVAPGRCVVIEDAVAGVQAAKSAGMKCVAITNTHPAERLAGADLVVTGLEDVSAETLCRLFA